ncbi:Molybdopterin adenylyltransferase [Corynebacterium kalinowskii]|uniref:Molybdopterin adenylyltransferase n=1 Tax=Corynebacterium kalinowskii TaxID=2675216 RepID=A0A6B8VAS7_9CORY|nr:MogA/MoaB family molybdenum cofactor biosynthesis protein [Corynebacterium kalinowskii]QGU01363.1 Molybdopterin adenylyltransferase [Corynebacterium kalinowskii]
MENGINGVVITISDRCAQGIREDKSGPLAVERLAEFNVSCPPPIVVTDDIPNIQAAIRAALDDGARFIFTTGGTGVTPRDHTPEATKPFLETELPGIAEQIRAYGLQKTPLAGLSRALVGISGRGSEGALIVNAPGSTGGVKDSIAVVGPLIEHVLSQLVGSDHGA